MAPDGGGSKQSSLLNNLFAKVEQYSYVAVGILLVISTVIAVIGAMTLLWHAAMDLTGTTTVFEVVDRLLFILMLVEIMHTVSASIRSGGLTVEPFLVVGLIASIRRVLVITLETSEKMQGHEWSAMLSEQFHASMIELGVLGGLILVMVVSIYMLHRLPKEAKQI